MIHVRGLTKTYKTRTKASKAVFAAVDGIDFDVEKGEIVGFLGPNGAGKTTTLRMLTTLLTPTSGTASVAGADLLADPVGVRRRIGYVAQSGAVSSEARAGEEIVDHALLYGLDRGTATARAEALLAQLDLAGIWNRTAKTLSGGQRRRLDIAMGLINDPALVFLDEPTTGLDPQARANLWQHIGALRTDRNATVFLTTHYLDEADALCDRIMVIDEGRIVASGTPGELKRSAASESITLTVNRTQLSDALAVVNTMDLAGEPTVSADTIVARVRDGSAAVPGLVRRLDVRGIALEGLEVRRPTLDDVFLNLTGRSLRETT